MGFFQDFAEYWRAITICLVASLGALQFGYDQSYFSGILVMEKFIQDYGTYDAATGEMVVTASRQSLVTSIINAGEFIGAVCAFWVGQKVGLRGGLLVACCVVVVGCTLQVAGTHIGTMIAGRLVLGFAVGLISCFVPLYIADCAPAKIRGAMVSMYQFNIGIGLLLGVCVDYATANRTDTGAFRIPIAVQYIFPIFLSLGLFFCCPESPRWLAQNNRVEDCQKALQRLHGPGVDVREDLERIHQSLHEERTSQEGSTWSSVFKSGPERRKAYLGFAIQALQQASGINFITGYGVYFFTVIGIKNAFDISVALYVCCMPALWASQVCIEKLGRRPMLLVSGFFAAAATMIMGGVGLNPNPTYADSQAIVAMVFIFMFMFNMAWGPTVWVVTSEISTGKNRTKLMTISTCSNWFFNWLVSFTFPYLFDADAANLNTKVGFIFGSLMACATIWVYFLLPETAQRSLEEIHELFERGVPARKFASAVPQIETLDEKLEGKPETVEHVV
ncbi:sugar transporter [Xylariales sp. PMI_506]|nr:sugar transporter [Xylariales sp. PMI_506]